MYDNNGQYPIYLDLVQYAERMALDTRTMDINILQQRTPRFWKTKTENLKSIQDMVNNVDGMENTVITYEDINLDDTTMILEPAPYVADKVDEHKDKVWAEFLRLIGVSSMMYQKKERNIKDEIKAMLGGNVASRYNRFEPRQKAIEQINEMFGEKLEKPIEVKYYDGLPTSYEDLENNENESEVEFDE